MGGGASVPYSSSGRKSKLTTTIDSNLVPLLKTANVQSYTIELGKCEIVDAKVEVSKADAAVVALPRGGLLVNHSKGTIQFGIPPETIKDALLWGLSVPTTFVILGEQMFDRQLGINIAEFEFPAYFNYFVFGKRVTLITTSNVEKRVRAIFKETLLGPDEQSYDLSQDFTSKLQGGKLSKQNQDTHWPDFVQEGLALDRQREFLQVDDLLNFEILDRPTAMSLQKKRPNRSKKNSMIRPSDTGKIVLDNELNTYVKWNPIHKKYLVREGKRTIAQVDHKFLKPRIKSHRRVVHEPFEVPVFGVTMLGTSHGFDPKGTTTGFVVWVNRQGIMVDPPPDSAEVLRDMAIPTRLINGMILTHCHADHDAGAFQKILADSSIKIYTTQTIMDSFIRKYAAISNLDQNFLRGLFVFERVKIGEKKVIHGASFDFFYSLHVIPTIGFEVKFANEGLVYSGDTCTNFKLFDKMRRDKRIGKGRYEDLVKRSPVSRGIPAKRLPDGTWTAPYRPHILHEAGVPPIHTPLDILAKLPAETRERLFVVHSDQKSLADGKYAKKLKTLPQWSTLRIDVNGSLPEVIEKHNCLPALLSTVPFFKYHAKSPKAIQDLLAIGKVNFYKKGTVLQKPGDIWETSYVVRAGVAVEHSEDFDIKSIKDMYSTPESMSQISDEKKVSDATSTKAQHKPSFYYVGDFFGEQSLIVDDENGTGNKPEDGDDPQSAGAAVVGGSTTVGVQSTSASSEVRKNVRRVEHRVVAYTDLYTIDFPREQMLEFLKSSEIGETTLNNINAVAKARSLETWNVLRLNDTLDKIMNRVQQQEFQKLLSLPKRYAKYEVIFCREEKQESMYLVGNGIVNLFFKPQASEDNNTITTSNSTSEEVEEPENVDLGPGSLVGDVNCLKNNTIARYTLTAKTECTVYQIPRIAIMNFWNRFPGIKLQCIDRRYIR